MIKLFLLSIILSVYAYAEAISILPYGGNLSYDGDNNKSVKERASLYGVHITKGTLEYLLEFDFLKTDIRHKDVNLENLSQNDLSFAYGRYFKSYMYRGGFHYISTNDPILGGGFVGFVSLGGYKYLGYDKYTYGVEAYYSRYTSRVAVTQFTPYFTAYNALSLYWGSGFSVKANYQLTPDYVKESYLSFDVSETLYYKSIYLTLRGYGGEMVTGVKDSGFTVINTQDLMKTGYGVKFGYHFTPAAIFSLSYDVNNYEEIDLIEEGSSSLVMASFYYGF
ncbi:MAG: hypothetical protein Q9M40_10600 [Sulfurimonas sp.]|nr:hypothetical protein [Sulfurimonas sp.]